MVHLNLQIALGLTQIVFLAGGSVTHNKVGNLSRLAKWSIVPTELYEICSIFKINAWKKDIKKVKPYQRTKINRALSIRTRKY